MAAVAGSATAASGVVISTLARGAIERAMAAAAVPMGTPGAVMDDLDDLSHGNARRDIYNNTQLQLLRLTGWVLTAAKATIHLRRGAALT